MNVVPEWEGDGNEYRFKSALAAVILTVLCTLTAYPDNDEPGIKQFTVCPIGMIKKDGDKTTLFSTKNYSPVFSGWKIIPTCMYCIGLTKTIPLNNALFSRIRSKRNPKNPSRASLPPGSPVRPNLIAMTLCKIVSVKGNVIEIDDIDAFADTPVIDIKPYIPNYDDVENARVPEWIKKATGTGGE